MLLPNPRPPVRKLAVVGLAKNTGKTQTLRYILGQSRGEFPVGVTSIGRDGERYDVIDPAIGKPAIALAAGDLVATTGPLLREVPARVLVRTGHRTPLGSVVIGKLISDSTVVVAGPGTMAGVAAVADAMLDAGARQVLIDGAIDRRAAASPAVSDGVVVATGAVLSREIDEVAARTKDAVDLLTLPPVADPAVRRMAGRAAGSALLTKGGTLVPIPPRLALGGDAQAGSLFRQHRGATHLVLGGALGDPLLDELLRLPSHDLPTLVVKDGAKVLLRRHTVAWCRRRGLRIEVLRPTKLLAITVNPVAPQSHRFDSDELRSRIRELVPGLPVCDVLAPDFGDENIKEWKT